MRSRLLGQTDHRTISRLVDECFGFVTGLGISERVSPNPKQLSCTRFRALVFYRVCLLHWK